MGCPHKKVYFFFRINFFTASSEKKVLSMFLFKNLRLRCICFYLLKELQCSPYFPGPILPLFTLALSAVNTLSLNSEGFPQKSTSTFFKLHAK